MAGKASKLIQDLSHVPSIVGGLGLSIAAAQKALNLDYVENVERLLALVKVYLKDDSQDLKSIETFVLEMLKAMAPARYQFTETTLSVKMDLAQTLDLAASGSLGLGFGAVSINASGAVGYGYDYRAAASVSTVLQAHTLDENAQKALVNRAQKITDKALTLPETAQVDKDIIDANSRIIGKVLGIDPPAVKYNHDPEIVKPIDDINSLEVTKTSAPVIDLTGVFTDKDGDTLKFSAESTDKTVAEPKITGNKNLAVVATNKPGTVEIEVTADDSNGGKVTDAFSVTVVPASA